MIHETPEDVAAVLARHAPRTFARILDPAVGYGALLRPLVRRIKSSNAEVVCIDSNKNVASAVAANLEEVDHQTLQIIRRDFLRWQSVASKSFDLVVMNPPFAAQKQQYVTIDIQRLFPTIAKGVRRVPVEAAFMLKAASVLTASGRMLAILPASLIAAETTAWFRSFMSQLGAFRVVHELPAKTFANVEARVYLCVFDRGRSQGRIILQNHDLLRPQSLTISDADFRGEGRLDFGFFNSRQTYLELAASTDLNWTPLSQVAKIMRGTAPSPKGRRFAVHTTDYIKGFWRRRPCHRIFKKLATICTISDGDLLIKRVSRDCAESLGKPIGLHGRKCSDCVFIIRPHSDVDSNAALFAIRTLLGAPWGPSIIARGTGATYLTESGLTKLMVPLTLNEKVPRLYRSYLDALRARRFSEMLIIENQVRKKVFGIVESGE